MMLYKVLTMVNIVGGVITLVCLLRLRSRYQIAPRMGEFVFMSIVSISALVLWQIYTLTITGLPIWKIPAMYWWISTLYFAWAMRFSSMKKKGGSVVTIKKT